MCHIVSVCDVTDKKPYRSKRATPQSTTSGTATYSVAGVNNKLVNTPPRITSAPEVGVSEDEGFQLQMKAVDSEGDHLSFLLNETAPVSMGNVSLELNGLLTYTPCVDCYGEDAVYYTVWEQRLDNEPPLFVEGKLIIKIRNLPDSPTIQMYHKGHDVIPPSSVFMVSMEENTGSASMDMVYVLAAYDPDYMDNVKLTFDPPQHGNLTQYNQLTKVVLTEQDCSQPWQSRRPLGSVDQHCVQFSHFTTGVTTEPMWNGLNHKTPGLGCHHVQIQAFLQLLWRGRHQGKSSFMSSMNS